MTECWCGVEHEYVEECGHEWMLRPESDTYECLICGAER